MDPIKERNAVNTAPIARFVEPAPLSRLLRAVGTALASLRALIGRKYREGPAAFGPMSRAQEAQATREYALKFFSADPRFAADLCAAADRHERGEKT
ncbi:MAG TPA: hypothetical protein VIY30_10515 [Burkholderiaceae bacterium]